MSLFAPRRMLVVVHHKTMNESFEGIWDGKVHDGHYVLQGASLLLPQNVKRKLDGDVYLLASTVAFVQRIAVDAAA